LASKPDGKGAAAKDAGLPKSNKATLTAAPVPLIKDKKLDKANDKAEASESESKPLATPKRFSLFIKGLVPPTTEAEVREFFSTVADKVSSVYI
jgi:RNA recognition motif-containing protein